MLCTLFLTKSLSRLLGHANTSMGLGLSMKNEAVIYVCMYVCMYSFAKQQAKSEWPFKRYIYFEVTLKYTLGLFGANFFCKEILVVER